MNALTLVLQVTLVAGMLLQAAAAAFRPRRLGPLITLPDSRRGRLLAAGLFLVAGVATAAGAAVPFLAFFASCIALAATLVLLVLALRAKRPPQAIVAILLACLAIGTGILQPLGLKVAALPPADDLPVRPVPARVVKTYDEGLWFEGIAAGADGTLFLAGNRNLDFSRADYYVHAQGEVIQRDGDGQERVVFRTPQGSTAGVLVAGSAGELYMTSHAEVPAIWVIDTNGQGRRLAQFPHGAWPNGLDLGPDGLLYSPDSSLGVVWRIDPKTGRTEQALRDERLLARPFISLAPGANGLHFSGRGMYVTVSDRTAVLRYAMQADGKFDAAATVATGIPGDDFAIGKDGSLFVTTHPYDTIVQVSPRGERSIIGGKAQHVVGATDAVFGRGASDRETLYVVTDGGAFTGGPRTRGELLALQPYGR